MKVTGINHFYNALGLDTGSFRMYYAFEEGAGTVINSVSGGQSWFTGVLAATGVFWSKPGSGYASGSPITVQNASGLDSPAWTMVFGYEKINANPALLFSSMSGTSGCRIGLTSTNKPYFETFDGTDFIAAASLNNYSSKCAVTLSYMPNYLSLGYFNFNSQQLEQEVFAYPFNLTRSDAWTLFPAYTGYVDFFLYFSTYYDATVLNGLLSGLYAYPTGVTYPTQTTCTTGVTGVLTGLNVVTGITGYQSNGNAGDGYADYAYVFPTAGTTIPLTGVISATPYSTPLTGIACSTITGDPVTLLQYLSGYAQSFGMQKIQLYDYVSPGETIKDSYSRLLFDNRYNVIGTPSYSGFFLPDTYTTGGMNVYWNGVGQGQSGWTVLYTFLAITGTDSNDQGFLDIVSGDMRAVSVTGGLTTFPWTYTGQELYLNGVNLITGDTFTAAGGNVTLIGSATGVSGTLFEYPIVRPFATGAYMVKTGALFLRNTSNVYRNGIRQQLRNNYIEGAVFDLMSGNGYNPAQVVPIYENSDLYWD